MPALRCGADRLGEYKHLFKDARVGLVTTPTGRTSDGRSTIAALQQAADLRVLLGPEHGVRGDGAAGRSSPSIPTPPQACRCSASMAKTPSG